MAFGPVRGLQFFPNAVANPPVNVRIDANDFNDSGNWVISPATKQFSVPVKIGRYEVPDEVQGLNETATNLFLCIDVDSQYFALPQGNPVRGSIVMVRCDGQDLDEHTIYAMAALTVGYINATGRRFKEVTSGELSLETFYIEVKAQLTRERAAKRYQDLKQDEMAYENPFRITPADGVKFCDSCGATQRALGDALFLCGVCGEGRYCSKECQKREWKVHKSSCKKP
ncbi:hypothetical protein DOTSEDRAFT_34222 [Dothistroma septosporum NZE10]|uniref:MYND-type domain-containing protein n=1 Tax=Dothistroma septosporum (strain NZE10 / CBS 128990) TaxID=675120 RepID=N1PQQ6_DOTSN|nr:hypothetical protein DOTSEDRAFT_34222 [Dothistroma septosporum NZE10]